MKQLTLRLRFLLLIASMMYSSGISQTVIKENVTISPSSSAKINNSKNGRFKSIQSWETGIQLRCGGLLNYVVYPYLGYGILHDTSTFYVNGQAGLVNHQGQGPSGSLGSFDAGTNLQFTFDDRYYRYDILTPSGYDSGEVVWTNQQLIVGSFPPHIGADYISADLYWPTSYYIPAVGGPQLVYDTVYAGSIVLQPDSSTCLDERPTTGPPRQNLPLVLNTSSHLIAWADPNTLPTYRNLTYRDTLYYNTRLDSMRLDPAFLGYFAFWDLGDARAGDSLEFSLFSGQPYVQGQKFYASSYQNYGDYYDIDYTNWLDNFDQAYRPASIQLADARYTISFDKQSAMPGDTVKMFVNAIGSPEDPGADIDVNILVGRQSAALGDTTGNLYGPDVDSEPAWWYADPLVYSQVDSSLKVIISPTAQPGSRIIVQLINLDDYVSSGRGIITIGGATAVAHFCSPVISEGDTTDIVVKSNSLNCIESDFPSTQLFNVYFRNPSDTIYGKLLNQCTGELLDSLGCVPQGFKFVAASDTGTPDGHPIFLDVQPIANSDYCPACQGPGSNTSLALRAPETDKLLTRSHLKGKTILASSNQKRMIPPRQPKVLDNPSCATIPGAITSLSIMLGETKYFE
ncbi:MAG TPA: hypothetical protein VKS81_07350, partial [Bacteroidota bacterium]|nr:hypothetical protein [Bacteroidota bacterium]